MKKKEKFHLFHSVKREIYYSYIRIIRLFSYLFSKNIKHQFLFILSPPYAGSTMLNQLISSSNNVSCNNNLGTREGQLLPQVRNFMFRKDPNGHRVTGRFGLIGLVQATHRIPIQSTGTMQSRYSSLPVL